MILIGETEVGLPEENPVPVLLFPLQISTPGLCGGRLATNLLNRGTVFRYKLHLNNIHC